MLAFNYLSIQSVKQITLCESISLQRSIALLHKLVWLAVAGALGALARYGLTELVERLHGTTLSQLFGGGGFPYGTLVTNVLGCFLFGLLWSALGGALETDSHTRLIIFVGFLGSFTTFSTYLFEASQHLQNAQWAFLAAHILAQNGLGLAAVFVGLALGRVW